MTERVEMALKKMVVGSLRYYAHEAWASCEAEDSAMLSALADAIEDGTATDDEWIEAISQINMGD